MLYSFLIGIGGIIALLLVWMIVQTLWGKTFAEYLTDEDVMAGRSSCSNCGCTTACENKRRELNTGSQS